MLMSYLSLYLIFLIAASVVIGFLVFRLRLPSPNLVITFIIVFILSPALGGYFYISYFNSLPETIVPDVTGLTVDQAREKLTEVEVKARTAGTVFDLKFPEGRVVSQRPEPGRVVKVGRVVNLIVSSGAKKVPVPDLLGRMSTQADAVLSAAELRVGQIRYEKSSGATEGTIIAQEPLPGEEEVIGGGVDLLVSTTLESVMIQAGSGEAQ
jgi:eukaryotic-like serine/threonine-protein kinase